MTDLIKRALSFMMTLMSILEISNGENGNKFNFDHSVSSCKVVSHFSLVHTQIIKSFISHVIVIYSIYKKFQFQL